MIYKLLLVDPDNKILSIRTEDSLTFASRKHEGRRRFQYETLSDRFHDESAKTTKTTYFLTLNPGIFPSILRVNRTIYHGASHLLYSAHTFDFGLDVDAVIPFLSDLTPSARSYIKRINIVQRAFLDLKHFDRCEWRRVCAFISKNVELDQLGLGIQGGETATPWKAKDTFTKSDHQMFSTLEGMEWVMQLAEIKGLKDVHVKAHLEHCPLPCSNRETFFLNFSASIEQGFAAFLKLQMLAPRL